MTNYTPAVTEIFPLVESDIGRPIGHIRSLVTYDELQNDARRVIRKLASAERELTDPVTRTRYMVRILPYRRVGNFIGGVVVTFTNVTRLTRAQGALSDSETRFRAIANLMPDLLWSGDAGGQLDWFNRRWFDFTGESQEEAQGNGWIAAIHPDDRRASIAAANEGIASGEPFALEHRMRGATGEYRWFMVRAEPTRDEAGKAVRWFGAVTDIHDQRAAMEGLKDSERQTRMLLAELQHRVRNSLAVVRSIARRTAESSDTVEHYAQNIEGRLGAFARVQAAVTRNPAGGIDLEGLIREELLSYAVSSSDQVNIQGPSILLRPSAAETIGLAIHELCTNALKYGSLSALGGTVDISWHVKGNGGDAQLVIDWSEKVAQPLATPSRRRGFGSELIEQTIPYQLHGETQFQLTPEGVRCQFVLPLQEVVAHSQG